MWLNLWVSLFWFISKNFGNLWNFSGAIATNRIAFMTRDTFCFMSLTFLFSYFFISYWQHIFKTRHIFSQTLCTFRFLKKCNLNVLFFLPRLLHKIRFSGFFLVFSVHILSLLSWYFCKALLLVLRLLIIFIFKSTLYLIFIATKVWKLQED